MKRNVRKILSLVLMVVMLFGVMVPGALAAGYSGIPGYSSGIIWDTTSATDNWMIMLCYSNGGHIPEHQHSANGYAYFKCAVCGLTGYTTDYGASFGHNHVYTDYGTVHRVTCSNPTCTYYNGMYEAHFGTNCPCKTGTGTGGTTTPTYPTVTAGLNVGQTDSMPYDTFVKNDTVTLTVLPKVYDESGTDITDQCTFTYTWGNQVLENQTGATAYADTTGDTFVASCVVTAILPGGKQDTEVVYFYGNLGISNDNSGSGSGTGTGTGTVTGTLTTGATVSNTNPGYALGNPDDLGQTSVAEQIRYAVSYHSPGATLTSVRFSSISVLGQGELSAFPGTDYYYNTTTSWQADLGNVVFKPAADFVGTVAFPFMAYYTEPYAFTTKSVSGTITFTVKDGGSALGIVYSALTGTTVQLDPDDFIQFWAEQHPRGNLNYVQFTGATSGSLFHSYSGTASQRVNVITGKTACYRNPTAKQTGLDKLTYVPASGISSAARAVTLHFTAYGTSTFNQYSTTSANGTITILYTNKEVTPIQYVTGNTPVQLKGDDFIAKYKEVMATNLAANLSIRFLEAPDFGSLYLNYGTGYYQNSGVKLSDASISNYTFSTATNAPYALEDLTYVSSGTADTVKFACYNGSSLVFIGTVNFGNPQQYVVEVATTAGKSAQLSSADFVAADDNGLLTSGTISLGTPSSGSLYKKSGAKVTAYDIFRASSTSFGSTISLNEVTYVPVTGFVGVAEIPFTATTYLGSTLNGTVKVYVGRNFTDVLGTPSVWAAPYINKLSAQGIVNGTGTGTTYSPTKTVTYGEALKLIMMAAGYPEQAQTSSHWASGYLTKAYYDGLIPSNKSIDLNAEITRDAIAELTAKALKLSPASRVNTGITAPVDSANGYVYAMYNAGIINGVTQNGKNYFLGGNSITRAEISKIICMVADYEA